MGVARAWSGSGLRGALVEPNSSRTAQYGDFPLFFFFYITISDIKFKFKSLFKFSDLNFQYIILM
jgi:hypothetical protein